VADAPIRRKVFLMLRVIAVVASICLCFSCASRTQPPSPAAQPVVIDDRALMEQFLTRAIALRDAGKIVKSADLIQQLGRSKCRLDLPSAPAQVRSNEQCYDKARSSVLVVSGLYKCEKCTQWHLSVASGFLLTASGACVTNYHVINDPKKECYFAMTADGHIWPVMSVLAASRADDVAILQIDPPGVRPIALAPAPAVGSPVCVISHPDNRFYTLSTGVISRYFTAHQQDHSSGSMFAVTADYARGSSGAPILNECGAAIGFVASTASIYYVDDGQHKDNLQMVVKQCIPAASILKLIER
jgi:S1-C subfamily serine protease